MLITLIILVLSAAFFVAGPFRLLQLGGDYDGGLVRCGRRHFSDRAG